MLTKVPDYIISECGYPNWNREKEKVNLAKIHENLWSTNSIWSAKSTNFAKLLPLRETLTDYYMEKLMMCQSEPVYKTTAATATATATKPAHHCNKNNNNSGRRVPRHMNEVIKNSKRNQQQQCALDKRRSCGNIIDKDLDQF